MLERTPVTAKWHGFTLIELLLVIAIIAAIMLVSLRAYQQKLQALKYDKAALQIQQWQQAAMSYYAVNNKWPSSTSDLINARYMPGSLRPTDTNRSDLSNPWCKGTDASNNPCFIVAPDSEFNTALGNKNVLNVMLVIQPNLLASATMLSYVQSMVANRLAYAQAYSTSSSASTLPNLTGVLAQINIPSQNIQPNGGINIVYIGNLPSGAPPTVLDNVKCPAGTLHVYYASSGMIPPYGSSTSAYTIGKVIGSAKLDTNVNHQTTVSALQTVYNSFQGGQERTSTVPPNEELIIVTCEKSAQNNLSNNMPWQIIEKF